MVCPYSVVFFPQANIHSIMGCEDQVLELMVLLDKGVQEAVRVEERLEEYDLKLKVGENVLELLNIAVPVGSDVIKLYACSHVHANH